MRYWRCICEVMLFALLANVASSDRDKNQKRLTHYKIERKNIIKERFESSFVQRRIDELDTNSQFQNEYDSEDEKEYEPEAPLPKHGRATFGLEFGNSAVESGETFLVQNEEKSKKKFAVDKKACTKEEMKKIFSYSRRRVPAVRRVKFIISASLVLIFFAFLFIYINYDLFVL